MYNAADAALGAMTLFSLLPLCNSARSVLKSICISGVTEGALAYCVMDR